MTKSTIRFSSACEKQSFETGIALAHRRMAGHHIETAAERSARCIREGEDIIVQRLGSAVALKTFGIRTNPQARRFEAAIGRGVTEALFKVASPVKPPTSIDPELPVSSNPNSTFKRMSVSFGLEQNARRLAAIA